MEEGFLVFVLNEKADKDFDDLFTEPITNGLKVINGWKKTDNITINILKIQNSEPDCILLTHDFFIEHQDVYQQVLAAPSLKVVPLVIVADINKVDSHWLQEGVDDIIPLPVQKTLFFQRLKILCEVGYYRKDYDKNFLVHFFEDR